MISSLLNNIEILNYSIATEIFLAVSGLILIVFGVKSGDKATCRISIFAAFAVIFAFFLTYRIADGFDNPIAQFYIINPFVTTARILLVISAFISLILYIGHLNYNNKNARFEYPIIMIFSLIGMLIMVSANDFLSLYIGLELQSLAIYILVSINRESLKSAEAGLKYFVLGALSSGILLYGISLIYGFSGTILFPEISSIVTNNDINMGMLIGMILVLVSLSFKISAVPFHMWTPDVYEGAPTPVTLFMSTAPKIAGFVILLRVLTEPLAGYYADWQQIIMFLAIASLLVGAMGAIRQNNFKRLLAYSSINHVGFMLLAILVFSDIGKQALLIYLMLYITMIFGAFAFLMIIKQSHHSVDVADKKPLEDIKTFSGLSESMPLIAIGMSVILVSMAGIPPFAGFFGKFFIFNVLIEKGFYKLAITAALSAVIAAYYYLKIIKIMFFDKPVEEYQKNPTFPTIIVFIIMILFNLFFFIEPNLLFDISKYSVDLF